MLSRPELLQRLSHNRLDAGHAEKEAATPEQKGGRMTQSGRLLGPDEVSSRQLPSLGTSVDMRDR